MTRRSLTSSFLGIYPYLSNYHFHCCDDNTTANSAFKLLLSNLNRNVNSIVPPAYITYSIPWEIQLFTQIMAHGHGHVRRRVTVTSSTGLKLGIALVLYASINVKPEGEGGGGEGPRAYMGHLTPRDPYHVPDILDLKRGWTGINNAHACPRHL